MIRIKDFLTATMNLEKGEDFQIHDNRISFTRETENVSIIVLSDLNETFMLGWNGNQVAMKLGCNFVEWPKLEEELKKFGVSPKLIEDDTEEEGW
jgi:hypothetical protein